MNIHNIHSAVPKEYRASSKTVKATILAIYPIIQSGKANAATAAQLARIANITDSHGVKVRHAAKVIEYWSSVDLEIDPIISCTDGLFKPMSRAEYNEYIDNLHARIKGLERDVQIASTARDLRFP